MIKIIFILITCVNIVRAVIDLDVSDVQRALGNIDFYDENNKILSMCGNTELTDSGSSMITSYTCSKAYYLVEMSKITRLLRKLRPSC